jgi:hypothetical protein
MVCLTFNDPKDEYRERVFKVFDSVYLALEFSKTLPASSDPEIYFEYEVKSDV